MSGGRGGKPRFGGARPGRADGRVAPGKARPHRGSDSGATNAGDAFDLRATRRAAESTYAGIVRLVEAARRSKAPMARLADRFAMVFLAVTAALAGGAWLLTADPDPRARGAGRGDAVPADPRGAGSDRGGGVPGGEAGVLVKGGKALETLARTRALVLDKTGTLTRGRAQLVEVRPEEGIAADEVLRLGASLDQASKHVMAQAIVAAARSAASRWPSRRDVVEMPGEGLEGTVEGRSVVIGGRRFVAGGSEPRATGLRGACGSMVT